MNLGLVSKRYAVALYEYAKGQRSENAIYENMLQYDAVCRDVAGFLSAIANPDLAKEQKMKLLCDVAGEVSPTLHTFLQLLLKKERATLIGKIAHSYIGQYRKENNIVAVKITTAVPMSMQLQEQVKQIIAEGSNATIELKNAVDANVIGGFLYECNYTRLDATIATRLKKIKDKIVEHNRRIV